MEHQRNHRPDEEPQGSKSEQLEPGEIDYAGTISQEEGDLKDTLAEAESSKDVIPDAGAQTIARALAKSLANRVPESQSEGIRHFAIAGRVNQELILRELAIICASSADEETHEWADRLGAYVMTLSDEPGSAARPNTGPQPEPTPTTEAVLPDIPPTAQGIRAIRHDATTPSTDTDLGVLTIYRTPFFSIDTRNVVVADFRTGDGAYSQVHRLLRSNEYFVVGAHGDNNKRGLFHPTIEAAVDDALREQPEPPHN